MAVIGIKNVGKASDSQPLLSGHTDGITALDFSPFDDHILATGSRDTTVYPLIKSHIIYTTYISL